jgi:hypothetical protein
LDVLSGHPRLGDATTSGSAREVAFLTTREDLYVMCRIFTLPTPRGSRLIELKHSLLSQSCAAVCVGTSSNGPHPPGTSPRNRGKVLVRRRLSDVASL